MFTKDNTIYSNLQDSFEFSGVIKSSEERNTLEGKLTWIIDEKDKVYYFKAAQVFKPSIEVPKEPISIKAGEEITKPLHDNVANCATPDQLKDHIMECTLIRTWQGDSTLIRLATSSELRELCSIAVKLIVLAGGQVRYGPPPRGPMERATAACLSQLTQK